MKQYSTIHVDKSTTAGGSLGQHIDRKKQPKNADPTKEHLNFALVKEGENIKGIRLKEATLKPLATRVKERIAEGYTGRTAIRKDAVTQLNVMLTGSHDKLSAMNGKEVTEWALENYRFLAKEYGVKNIVGFAVHLDERTPHIHATIVPLTPDGRLSAREIVGNNKKLAALQDRYSQAMKPFGLERGEIGSKVAHVTTAEYYKAVNSIKSIQEQNTATEKAPLQLEKPPMLLVAREEYVETQQKRIEEERKELMEKNATLKAQVAYTTEANFRLKQEKQRAERTLKESEKSSIRDTIIAVNKKLNPHGMHFTFDLDLSKTKTKEELEQMKQQRKDRGPQMGG